MLLEILGLAGIFAVPLLDKAIFGDGTNTVSKISDQIANQAANSGNKECMDSAERYYEAKKRRSERNSGELIDTSLSQADSSDSDY